MVETGAHNHQWPDVHMQPEESLQAHLDFKGKTMLPIHNGTFDLSMHARYEPFERIVAPLADTTKVRISFTDGRSGRHRQKHNADGGVRWSRRARRVLVNIFCVGR